MKLTEEQKTKLTQHLIEIGDYLTNKIQPNIKDVIEYTWVDGRTNSKYELTIRPKKDETESIHNCVRVRNGYISYYFQKMEDCKNDWDREHTILNFEITNANIGLSIINNWSDMKTQLLGLVVEQNTIIDSLNNFTL